MSRKNNSSRSCPQYEDTVSSPFPPGAQIGEGSPWVLGALVFLFLAGFYHVCDLLPCEMIMGGKLPTCQEIQKKRIIKPRICLKIIPLSVGL
jgi:hypothetical protein